jgi:flagella basal body P-ring formation protein FlgA
MRLKTTLSIMLPPLLGALAIAVHAAPPSAPGSDALEALTRFLQERSAGLPGKVGIRIDTAHAAALPACATPEPFLPNGARLWGRVSVGIRCNTGQPWTRYLGATISVTGNYYVATRAINAGETLAPGDFSARDGDLTTLPRSVITNAALLEGMVATNGIAAGAPLRQDFLRGAVVVQQGQSVKVVAQGPGFVVSTEAKAMSNAAAGATVQLKTGNGQMVSGIVRGDGSVELPR